MLRYLTVVIYCYIRESRCKDNTEFGVSYANFDAKIIQNRTKAVYKLSTQYIKYYIKTTYRVKKRDLVNKLLRNYIFFLLLRVQR